ncbi:Synaptobrevin [Macleaya cordata]|uniref:Synaptobrevin n=1 Tax=Macleaya cordata TaxID=56857 RepID=A0A200Q3X9_MACCD|nr:Synaptobrevin [Macleaya cordata]
MSQESSLFIYSFVARGTMILAEYTELITAGNFPAIASQYLQNLPSNYSNNRQFITYNYDHHTFNFLVEDGYTYCVVSKESLVGNNNNKQLSIAFLERVKADFKKRYDTAAPTAIAKSLNKEFGPVMKEHMQYITDEHVKEIEKLLKVKAQVSEVKSIMLENIEEVVDRGVKLDVIVDKTQDLHFQAQVYRERGTQLQRKLWFQNMKIKLVVLGVLLLLALVIWVSVCQGFNCTN